MTDQTSLSAICSCNWNGDQRTQGIDCPVHPETRAALAATPPSQLEIANARVRVAAQRLQEANDELDAAEREWREANDALEDLP